MLTARETKPAWDRAYIALQHNCDCWRRDSASETSPWCSIWWRKQDVYLNAFGICSLSLSLSLSPPPPPPAPFRHVVCLPRLMKYLKRRKVLRKRICWYFSGMMVPFLSLDPCPASSSWRRCSRRLPPGWDTETLGGGGGVGVGGGGWGAGHWPEEGRQAGDGDQFLDWSTFQLEVHDRGL